MTTLVREATDTVDDLDFTPSCACEAHHCGQHDYRQECGAEAVAIIAAHIVDNCDKRSKDTDQNGDDRGPICQQCLDNLVDQARRILAWRRRQGREGCPRLHGANGTRIRHPPRSQVHPMSDLCFVDTETLGIHPDAPIWEFAAIRCRPGLPVERREFFIEHDPGSWAADLPKQFADDYDERYKPLAAYTEATAATEIHYITNGATIVGAVPNFDTERLDKLLRRNGLTAPWHYHLVDVENLAVGWLSARGRPMPPPWNSDTLSAAVGVDPDRFERHTAMGDVRWVQAQYHAIMGGAAA